MSIKLLLAASIPFTGLVASRIMQIAEHDPLRAGTVTSGILFLILGALLLLRRLLR